MFNQVERMTEILAYRIVIVVLIVMVCAWARCAQRQSNALLSATNRIRLGKTATEWLRASPEAVALLTAYKATLEARAEELTAAATQPMHANGAHGEQDDTRDMLIKAMITRLEVESVRDLLRASRS